MGGEKEEVEKESRRIRFNRLFVLDSVRNQRMLSTLRPYCQLIHVVE